MSFVLSLSGGVVRGVAHLGVLLAFDEAGIKPAVIAGVSAGSIAAAFYSKGIPPKETLTIIRENKIWHYLRPGFGRGGLFSLRRTEKVLQKFLGETRIEELEIPVLINAVDFEKGELVSFTKGPVIPAILSSSSIPMLFDPYEYEGSLYVDGGIFENTPFRDLESFNLPRLGVDVMQSPRPGTKRSFRTTMERSIELITQHQAEKHKPENLLCPLADKYFSLFDLSKAEEIFSHAHLYARKWLQLNAARFPAK